MSTILKSLKKLEEEKSILEKSIDLKSLVVHGGQGERQWHPPSLRQIFTMTAFVGVGLVVGGLWFAGVFESKPVLQTAQVVPVDKIPTPPKNIAAPAAPDLTGISLASIPSAPAPVMDSKPPVAQQRTPDLESQSAIPKQTAVKPMQPKSVGPPLQEASNAVTALLPKPEPVSLVLEPVVPAVPEPQEVVEGTLPGLTLRGIIYFGDDSPFSYIFYSTAEKKNMKLKAGEEILGATLKKIEPDSAIFAYQGQLIQISIGP